MRKVIYLTVRTLERSHDFLIAVFADVVKVLKDVLRRESKLFNDFTILFIFFILISQASVNIVRVLCGELSTLGIVINDLHFSQKVHCSCIH